MTFYVLTLFPELIRAAAETSITGRAIRNGVLSVETVNIRDWSVHGTKRVDDYPYGGGAGMVMEAEPVFQAVHSVEEKLGHRPRVVYLTPQAEVLHQTQVEELANEEELILLCGHYEGIDERVLEEVVTDHISIGDYVLTGGELAAAVLIDAVSRYVPGVLHNEESTQYESLQDDLLEYPQYTRPEVWHGKVVPPVLLTGDHGKIREWRRGQSLLRTAERRPDLLRSSRQVWGIWYGGEAYGRMAERLTAALSLYGETLDYGRKKLQKQNRTLTERDLVLFVLPDGEQDVPVRDRFRNLRGNGAGVVLIRSGACEELSGIREFLKERRFRLVDEKELSPEDSGETVKETSLALRIRLWGKHSGNAV